MPPALTSKGLWTMCAPHGKLMDAFIANKLSKGGSNAYKKMASSFRKFLFFEKEESTALSSGRICISTISHQLISEIIQVDINNEIFEASVQEIRSWSTQLKDDYTDLSSNHEYKDVDHVSESIDDQQVDDIEIIQSSLNKIDDHDLDVKPNLEGEIKMVEEMNQLLPLTKKSKMTRLEIFRLKTMWWNFAFDYDCSMSRGRSGGKWNNSVGSCYMVNIYAPQHQTAKYSLWNRLKDFVHHNDGSYIFFGDMNVVRNKKESINKTKKNNRKVITLEELSFIEKKIDNGLASQADKENRISIIHESEKLDSLESMDLLQKAHIKWDVECDENSKFFHGLVNQKSAIWDCGSSKAPGPDGYTFAFVKKFWGTIHKDLHEFVDYFFTFSTIPHGATSFFFTLIPNVNNHTCITNFRAISLIGIHYKIIAKVLANRLAKVIDKIIKWYKIRKQKLLIFKVDFEKAFDSISWKFLDHILVKIGFGQKWCSWIKACLISSKASILVNGSPTFEFAINRCLRQEDPLSPFLFILIMEGLHNSLADAMNKGLISGVTLNNSNINISYLLYVDDVIITFEWNARELENIIRVLHIFYLNSGLKINIHKSNIYGIGVNDEDISSMAHNVGCNSRALPFTYLDFPI
nr:RNA-directed DNA polymerase, eukaryota [Tanacetum cinerariifolium]